MKAVTYRGLVLAGAACALLVASGCADRSMVDLKQYVDEVKSRKRGQIEPLPELKQVETYVYSNSDGRNPFVPLQQGDETAAANVPGNGLAPDPTRRKEELESYSLDSLRMVGTLEQTETRWALVKTSDATIYRVKAGNYLGRNHGQISRITETEIELTEIVADGQGGFRERQASLALKE